MLDIYNNFYKGKKVIVTGHTGFKGSWLCIWLRELGAEVVGIGLSPYTDKDNFVLSGLSKKICSDVRCDIRNGEKLKDIFKKFQPEIVFHLAAQPLVRLSYEVPVETYQVNVMGTINVMEAIRGTSSVKVAVMITSDKCYENKERLIGFKETDSFGGYDPYSSSKGACEIAIQSWRRSFFNPQDYGIKHHVSIASVRAGNVIGGGDWAKDRIVPDCIRALESGKPIDIRSPNSVRPWEHVLEPISGYMLLAKKMWENPTEYCEGWNFGPKQDSLLSVWQVASAVIKNFTYGVLRDISDKNAPHEANILVLDISKAKERLEWSPRLNTNETITLTCDWYKRYMTENVYSLCVQEIERFISVDFS